MIKPLRPLNVRIPADLRKKLMAISKRDNVPVSDLVRESLKRYLAVRQFRELREKIMPLAGKKGWLTDEDVFKEIS